MSNVYDDVAELQTQVAALQSQVAQLQGTVTNINTKLNTYATDSRKSVRSDTLVCT